MVDRISRPAGEALAAGDAVEQMGVLRMSLGQYTSAVSHLGVLARLVAGLRGAQSSQPWGSYAFPGPPSAMMVVGGMGARR